MVLKSYILITQDDFISHNTKKTLDWTAPLQGQYEPPESHQPTSRTTIKMHVVEFSLFLYMNYMPTTGARAHTVVPMDDIGSAWSFETLCNHPSTG